MKLARACAQFAIYLVPAVAIGLAFALLLIGRGRVGLAARVYGGPPGLDGVVAWRVVAIARSVGVEVPLRGESLQLSVSDGSNPVIVRGVTDEDGAWEARLALGTQRGSMRVEVSTVGQKPRIIGLNQISPNIPAWQGSFKLDPLAVQGVSSGDLVISVSPARGMLAVPYPEDIVLEVRERSGGDPVRAASITLHGQGAVIEGSDRLVTDNQGRCRTRLHAIEHEARLEITALSTTGQEGKWSGALPVEPGAMWIDPAASREGQVRVLSPVERRQAYVTLLTQSSRLYCVRLALQSDSGGARGAIAIPKPPPHSWILISQDPPGRETDAVAWPVPDPDGHPRASATIRTPLVVDGTPMVEKAVRAQSLRTRVRALSVLGAAALIEAILLWWRARVSRRETEASMVGQPDLDEALKKSFASGPVFWMRMVIGSVLIALGFLSFALLTWIGTS
jgi:hypothetical protein